MQGFFNIDEPDSPVTYSFGCDSCGLGAKSGNKFVDAVGKNRENILIVTKSPPFEKDRLHGSYEKVLGDILKKNFGLDIYRDCRVISAVNCASTSVTSKQVEACRFRVIEEVEKQVPSSLVILAGNQAITSVIGTRWKKRIHLPNISAEDRWRGWCIPDREYGKWLCPLSISNIFDDRSGHLYKEQIIQDLEKYLNLDDIHYPPTPEIQYLYDSSDIIRLLQDLTDIDTPVAVDYETTGLKPQRKGHRIVSMGVAPSPNKGYAWMVDSISNTRVKEAVQDWWESCTPKIAGNMSFETVWTDAFFMVKPENWIGDTVLGAHVLDNRPGTTSVKFQTYARLGICGYDDDVSEYLKAQDDKDATAFNRIHMIPEKTLLEYNALDCVYEYRLWCIMKKELGIG